MSSFSQEVANALGLYVYRLIDPRNGETFYVGKGVGNRVFQHAAGAFKNISANGEDLKSGRINAIRNSNHEVWHIIHRHRIKDPETAFEIEAALMDAYPGLTNAVRGHGSADRGATSAAELISRYSAEEITFKPGERFLLISIPLTARGEERSIYDSVRHAWALNERRLDGRQVIAHVGGIVRGVFTVDRWLKADAANFPGFPVPKRPRLGFEGKEILGHPYLTKRIPNHYFPRGARAPVRYVPRGK